MKINMDGAWRLGKGGGAIVAKDWRRRFKGALVGPLIAGCGA